MGSDLRSFPQPGRALPVTALAVTVLALATSLLAACGDGDDGPPGPNIGGLYEVTHHTLNDAGCEAEGADEADPPYFRLLLDQFFGRHYYALDSCSGPTDETCEDFGNIAASFFESTGSGWRGDIQYSIGGDDDFPCILGLEESSALPSGDDIEIEIRSYTLDAPDLLGDACDPEQATARREQLVCERLQVVHGTRPPD